MPRLLYFLFLISYSLFPGISSAQRFGGNPPSTKWMQINTDTVRVIYQEGLESQAKRVVNLTHHLNRNTAASIGSQSRKIDVVLQNQTTISNAYVGLAPWRSEFYMTPLQNSLQLGSISWVDNLSMHEYRHVQQYMNFRKGLSKWAFYILGEQGQGVANAMAVPDWFFEGDAVFQETGVSPQGRGRLPDF
ncbi:MAG: TolB family protein, partial [Chitinophagaceae bacterium]